MSKQRFDLRVVIIIGNKRRTFTNMAAAKKHLNTAKGRPVSVIITN